MSQPGLVVAVDHGDDRLVHAEERGRDVASVLHPLLGAPDVICTHPVRSGGAHYLVSLAYPGAGADSADAIRTALDAAELPAVAVLCGGDGPDGVDGVDGVTAASAAESTDGATGHRDHALAAARDHAQRVAGRAISFPGQDGLRGDLPVDEVVAGTAIEALRIIGGITLDAAMVLQTREFVRPQYADGKLVLLARPAGAGEIATFEVEFTHECCGGH